MKQKLIDAAIRQYALHGYEGASMRKIAEEVDIKPASIYFFYKNKEALFIAAFEQLLERHFLEMKQILKQHENEPVEEIFRAMLKGLVHYHQNDTQGTIAYITLVTSPIIGIKEDLQEHFHKHNEWLASSLESAVKRDYPDILNSEIETMINQYVLIANGLFWGTQVFDSVEFTEHLKSADHLLHTLFFDLEHRYTSKN